MSEHAEPILIDPAMRAIDAHLARVARGDINVLLLGETGTGKEVLATRVHQLSARAAGPFIRINCAAISESLLESELFGHVKGAFTGADVAHVGLLASADGGTVFLDEIGELPLTMQAKLLRVIEHKQVMPVGGTAARAIDVRFVSATNRDLAGEVEQRRFRADLFFRVGAYATTIPPLRQRALEIDPLVRLFLRDSPHATVTPSASEALHAYHWPGNIRELKNVVETAALLAGDDPIEVHHLRLPVRLRDPQRDLHEPQTEPPLVDDKQPMRKQLRRIERSLIVRALDSCSGNQRRTARLLGISRATLLSRLDDFGIPRPRKRA